MDEVNRDRNFFMNSDDNEGYSYCSTPERDSGDEFENEMRTKNLNITDLRRTAGGLIINSSVYISDTNWNTIISVKEGKRIFCAVCDIYINAENREKHAGTLTHRTKVITVAPLRRFELSITRRINNGYHCGVCNVIFSEVDDHSDTSAHSDNMLFAINKAYDLLYDSENYVLRSDTIVLPDSNPRYQNHELNGNYDEYNRDNQDNGDVKYYDGETILDNVNCVSNGYNGNAETESYISYTENEDIDRNNNSGLSASIWSGASYAQAAKTATDKVPKELKIDLGDKMVTVKYDSWNMIVYTSSNSFYCMACKTSGTRRSRAEHCAALAHVSRIKDCAVVRAYETHLVRRVSDKLYHCGHCNNLQPMNEMDIHIETKHDNITLKVDRDKLEHEQLNYDSTFKYNNGEVSNQTDNFAGLQVNVPLNALPNNSQGADKFIEMFNINKKMQSSLPKPGFENGFSTPYVYDTDIPIVSAHNVFENGAIRKVQTPNLSETGAMRKVQSPNMFETGAIRKVQSPNILETGVIQKVHTPNLSETGAIRKVQTPKKSETGVVRKVKSPNMFETGAIRKVQSPNILETGVIRNVQSPNMFETGVMQKAHSPNILETGVIRKVQTPTETQPIFTFEKFDRPPPNYKAIDKTAPIINKPRINSSIMIIYEFGFHIYVSVESFNTILKIKNVLQCLVCDMHIDDVQKHILQDLHIQMLQRVNFLPDLTCNLVRMIRNQLHCVICNIIIVNDRKAIMAHVSSYEHGLLLRKALSLLDAPESFSGPGFGVCKGIDNVPPKEPYLLEPPPSFQNEEPPEREVDPDRQNRPFDYRAIAVKLRNVFFKIQEDGWHSIVFCGDGTSYCFCCEVHVLNNQVYKHIATKNHLRNLEEHNVLDMYGTNLLRQMENLYHCVVCNTIITKKFLEHHLLWDPHKSAVNSSLACDRRAVKLLGIPEIEAVTQREKYDGLIDNAKSIILYNVKILKNRVIDNTELFDRRRPKIVIFNADVYKVDFDRWNGFLLVKDKLRCLICSVDFKKTALESHFVSKTHSERLEKPFCKIPAYGLVREVSEQRRHCVVCNIELSAYDNLREHVNGKKHQKNLEVIRNACIDDDANDRGDVDLLII